MSRFFWIRHGPTHAKAMVGWTDLPADLSDVEQLARVEAQLPADALVISSDLIRARATADALQGPRARLPDDPALREIHFGAWEMAHWDGVDDPARLRAFWDTPGDLAAPGGESWNAVSARVSAAVSRLMAAHPGRDIVAVAHFGAILTQVQVAQRLTPLQAFAQKINNLSLTELHHGPNGWHAARINHLA
ncbi:histidine phosphatase family protein [Rhodobacteraceae bacterium KMM 6894]|nr:histidine phosphatase family protein [Rhodobacteraceae bacterium KMM 6894]